MTTSDRDDVVIVPFAKWGGGSKPPPYDGMHI